MKKILCLVLCMVFVFSLAACSEESEEKGSHSVDVEYYANLGQINGVAYKLGDSVQETKTALEETVDDHGESNYFDYLSGEYTIMSDGAIYCCYKTEDESAGLTHVITTGDAYGFTAGAVSVEVRDIMSSIGFDAKERDAKRSEIFFLPAGAQMTVLEYKIQNNTLLFVFQEHYLAATVITKITKP